MQQLRRRFERLLEPADIRLDGERPWDVRIVDDRVFQRVLLHGTLGLGEAYMDGWWACDQLDELVARALRHGVSKRLEGVTAAARKASARVVNAQRGVRAWVVGEQHYDVGNELFERMLDPSMMYSCGYWATATDLAAAQQDKLALIAAKLQLEAGMRVLDIGCGWGGAAEYFARHHGCEVVGVTISREQADLARQRCADLPVEIRLQDYRELDEPFDRVLSIGMFEHVGHKNHRRYADVVRRCLAEPDSLTLLHTIGKNLTHANLDPWVGKYIFPNSLVPSVQHVARAIEGRLVLEDWHSFGPDYDPTLMAWHANVNAAWDDLPDRYDARFRRMWNFYLLSSAGAFRARQNQLWQVVCSRDGAPTTYRPARVR